MTFIIEVRIELSELHNCSSKCHNLETAALKTAWHIPTSMVMFIKLKLLLSQ